MLANAFLAEHGACTSRAIILMRATNKIGSCVKH
jgi:hypothetical protein